MAYWFAGFFARPPVARPAALPPGACWKAIAEPFDGIGVRLPDLEGEEPPVETIEALAKQFGLGGATTWVYLTYTCWAGRVDSVYGLVRTPQEQFGPLGESDGDKVRQAYLDLMARFGVAEHDALDFPPFYRGFWGDA
jgi:hypothetical protein